MIGLVLGLTWVGISYAAEKPNVLVVLVDDLGVGDLGCYGAEDLQTPNLDRLVGEGMRFDNAYANCPVCSPTRAAMLTGRYQELVGVPGVIRTYPQDNWGNLADDAVMLPALLKPAGYDTAIVGKWHLGLEAPDRPNDRGFDFFHGFLGDMMDDYYKHQRHGQDYMRRNEERIFPEGHATDLFSDWASDYVREKKESGRPWFLYLAYNAPHTPIQPPQDWLEKVKSREPGMTEKRARLVALIEHMDDGIGQVLGAIEESGQREETLVVFTSDNGGQGNVGANNGPWRGAKQDMYEGGLRVAGCAVWPGEIEAGSRTGVQIVSMDVFPTVLEAAGVAVPEGLDGRSVLGVLKGDGVGLPARDLFFTRREGNERYMGEVTWAMRRGDWKLVKNSPMGRWELFNLKDDPAEATDLAMRNRAKFRELAAAMRLQIQRGGVVPWQ